MELNPVYLTVLLLPGLLACMTRYCYGLGMLSFPASLVLVGLRELEISRCHGCGTGCLMSTNLILYASLGCLAVVLVAALRFYLRHRIRAEQGPGLSPRDANF